MASLSNNQLIARYNILETDKILNAFPRTLRQEVEKVLEILPFHLNIIVINGLSYKIDNPIHSNEQVVSLNKEIVRIPSRICLNEPDPNKEKTLTDLQKAILNCIYLRHHDGYVRQRRLEQLCGRTEYFIIPFIFQLLGEYVIEILFVADKCINDSTISNYFEFIRENPKYWQQTQSRMISYWNEYYRHPKFKQLEDYIGKKIIDRLRETTS